MLNYVGILIFLIDWYVTIVISDLNKKPSTYKQVITINV